MRTIFSRKRLIKEQRIKKREKKKTITRRSVSEMIQEQRKKKWTASGRHFKLNLFDILIIGI